MLWTMKERVITIVVGMLVTVPKRMEKETGGTGGQRKNWEYKDHSSVKISKNTEKGPGDLRRLAVTLTPAKNHQLKLVEKTRKE